MQAEITIILYRNGTVGTRRLETGRRSESIIYISADAVFQSLWFLSVYN